MATPPKKMFEICPRVIVRWLDRATVISHVVVGSSACTTFIPRIFNTCDLRSGHSCGLPIINQWVNIEMPEISMIIIDQLDFIRVKLI